MKEYERIILLLVIFIMGMYSLYLGRNELAATALGAFAGVLTQFKEKGKENVPTVIDSSPTDAS